MKGQFHSQTMVSIRYKINLSFATDFLIHFYDEYNESKVIERSGTYYEAHQSLPVIRNKTYLRVNVFNPKRLSGQTVTIGIRVRNVDAVQKTFELPPYDTYSLWYAVKANLI